MNITIQTGTEGPKSDPYGFKEYVVILERKTFILHLGLNEYIKVNDEIILSSGDIHISSKVSLENIFEKFLPINLKDIDRKHNESFTNCNKCGSTDIECKDGFPGETLYICQKCENIINTVFNRSAVE